MIPITDKHLWEACKLALEQDIADLETQPCSHDFSENFRSSIQQMQEKTDRKHTARSSFLRIRPLWRLLPAAALITLVCLAGYRLLELAPFRMGSAETGYSNSSEEAGQEAGACMEDTETYTMETDTAETTESAEEPKEADGGAPEESGEPAGEAAAEKESNTADDGAAVSSDKESNAEEGMLTTENDSQEGNLQESAEERAGASAGSSTSKKDSSAASEENAKLLLLSVAYDPSGQILEIELQNDSSRSIILENSWMLFDADGKTVNIEAVNQLPLSSRLAPGKTAVVRGMLPDGELPDGEYTLELNDGDYTLTFSYP